MDPNNQELTRQPAPRSERDILKRALDVIERQLPETWSMTIQKEPRRARTRVNPDAVLKIAAPNGESSVVLVEAKRLIERSDVPALIRQLQQWTEGADRFADAMPLLVARYVAPSTRSLISELGAGYVDATGNARLLLDSPTLFMYTSGADADPWRGRGRPRGTLKGEPAARVVRALADFRTPMTVPELADRAATSLGSTYRVVEFLESEDLISKDGRGPITDVRWRSMIERWSEDYGYQANNDVRTFLQPRGTDALMTALRNVSGIPYVITGGVAANQYEEFAPARLVEIYCDDPQGLADMVDARPVDSGSNVLIGGGSAEWATLRAKIFDGVFFAAPSQIAVDLLTGPGREPSQGEEFMNWMESNEDEWRR